MAVEAKLHPGRRADALLGHGQPDMGSLLGRPAIPPGLPDQDQDAVGGKLDLAALFAHADQAGRVAPAWFRYSITAFSAPLVFSRSLYLLLFFSKKQQQPLLLYRG